MATVLGYHGVTISQSVGIENFSRKHLPLLEFKQHIQSLANRSYKVISLEVFLGQISDQTFSSNEVVLTFDDGYQSHYDLVWPLLRDYNIPFTVFIAPGFLSQDRFFWFDWVEHWLNRTKVDAVSLCLPQGQRIWKCMGSREKITAVIEIKKILKRLRPAVRDTILEQLKAETRVEDSPESVENYRCMSWAELAEMARDPLVTIGSHSINHEILSNLTLAEAGFEISQSKQILEQKLGRPVTSFAYPNGKPEDYNQACIDHLESTGYSCAFKVVPDPTLGIQVTKKYEIPRIADAELYHFMS